MRWTPSWPATTLSALVVSVVVAGGVGVAYGASSTSPTPAPTSSAAPSHHRGFPGWAHAAPGTGGTGGGGPGAGGGFGGHVGGGFGGGGFGGGGFGAFGGGIGARGGLGAGGLLSALGGTSGPAAAVSKELSSTGHASVTVTVNGTTWTYAMQTGTVSAVGSGTLTLTSASGYRQTYTVPGSARIVAPVSSPAGRAGTPGSRTAPTLSDIHDGAHATVIVVNGTVTVVASVPSRPGGGTPPPSPGTSPSPAPTPSAV